MFIFLRLLLAHFLGDFPLQFDFIFKLKPQGWKGIIPHVLIIVFCCIVLSWPYLHLPQMWFFIILIGSTHLIQDSIKISYGTLHHSFWTYLADQLFHVGLIALVFLTDLSQLSAPKDSGNFLIALYSNDTVVIYLIFLILATYNGYFLIRCFKDTFLGSSSAPLFEKWYGMLERAIIVSCFLIQEFFILLIPIALLLRPIVFIFLKERKSLHKSFIFSVDTVLSWLIALITGFTMSYLLQAKHSIY